jgi:hypothetical protein
VISDRPVLVKPDTLRFPVSEEDGNSLKCDQDGLPKSIYLDGGERDTELGLDYFGHLPQRILGGRPTSWGVPLLIAALCLPLTLAAIS